MKADKVIEKENALDFITQETTSAAEANQQQQQQQQQQQNKCYYLKADKVM